MAAIAEGNLGAGHLAISVVVVDHDLTLLDLCLCSLPYPCS